MVLDPFPVEYLVPDEEEISGVVYNLHLNRSCGPSGKRVENIQAWLRAATREEFPNPSQWEMFVGLIQATFSEVRLSKECDWKTVPLIPNGNSDFRSIGLFKVLCKTVT